MIKIFISINVIQIDSVKFVLDHIFDVIGCKYKITDQKSAANVIYGSENDDKNILFLHHDKNLWDLEKINVEFSNYEYNYL